MFSCLVSDYAFLAGTVQEQGCVLSLSITRHMTSSSPIAGIKLGSFG